MSEKPVFDLPNEAIAEEVNLPDKESLKVEQKSKEVAKCNETEKLLEFIREIQKRPIPEDYRKMIEDARAEEAKKEWHEIEKFFIRGEDLTRVLDRVHHRQLRKQRNARR